jgi:hypothetical protein
LFQTRLQHRQILVTYGLTHQQENYTVITIIIGLIFQEMLAPPDRPGLLAQLVQPVQPERPEKWAQLAHREKQAQLVQREIRDQQVLLQQ